MPRTKRRLLGLPLDLALLRASCQNLQIVALALAPTASYINVEFLYRSSHQLLCNEDAPTKHITSITMIFVDQGTLVDDLHIRYLWQLSMRGPPPTELI